jgi:hypothetical protein
MAFVSREEPETSSVGLVLSIVSLAVMPALAYAKQRTGHALGSKALLADAVETWVCTYLSLKDRPAAGGKTPSLHGIVIPRPDSRMTRNRPNDARANLSTVSEDKRDQERNDRDRERSDEAHWRVAEGGADQQEDEPKQKTPEGREIPIPKREEFFGNLKEVSKPDRN